MSARASAPTASTCPPDEPQEAGYSQADLLSGAITPAFRRLLGDQIARAQSFSWRVRAVLMRALWLAVPTLAFLKVVIDFLRAWIAARSTTAGTALAAEDSRMSGVGRGEWVGRESKRH